ncbi:hypothetical protein PV326_008099 [Microctonus aethiopoides]|uniref:Cuticle protein n=1 Tax=Microctonus aethiopoides TaxID=144406 RepID=A0AA39FIV7_9HYME|nr:hypothetical protein PV326_008099 [Microctonus aethiopoides]KAK0170271.1 hypothetical protein PV328_010850 [Microctonus aethiopoides]
MAFKFVTFATLLAIANAGLLPVAYHTAPVAQYEYAHPAPYGYAAHPVAKAVVTKTVDTEYDPHPEYNFSYNVHDTLTGDAKSQEETRHGDVVEGSYSLIEADGSRRVVHYTADDVNGFNAVVEKQPANVAVKTVAPVVHSAPVAYKTTPVYHAAAPVYQSAPAVYHAAPAVYHSAPVAHAYTTPVVHGHHSTVYHH